jgi:hypothetical protein
VNTDPREIDLVNEVFGHVVTHEGRPVEVRPYTISQQLGRRWARLLHRLGIHDNVLTYRVGVDHEGVFEQRHYLVGGPNQLAVAKGVECSICHRVKEPFSIV